MVLPQYTFAAFALGALAAIAVTLYATLSTTTNPHRSGSGRTSRAGGCNASSSSRYRLKKCEVCQKRGDLLTLSCTHTYHKSCLLNLHGRDVAPECPSVCIVCWAKITPDERAEIEDKRNAECSICLDDMVNSSLVLECGHEYHNLCASKLIEYPDKKCPNCRVPLSAADLRLIVTSQ